MLSMVFANLNQTQIVNNTACWLEPTLGCGAVWLWGWHAHSSTLHGWESQAIDLSSIIQAARQGNPTEMLFMLVTAAVHWKWMESSNLILVWSQFYSFSLQVGGLDPCMTHSFKNLGTIAILQAISLISEHHSCSFPIFGLANGDLLSYWTALTEVTSVNKWSNESAPSGNK